MFEPQHYPDDIPYPGGTPRAPYDSAGYTLAFQMGVKFDRILDAFDGPFEKIEGFVPIPEGNITKNNAPGYYLDHRVNDSFIAINRLLKEGEKVFWIKEPVVQNNVSFPAGAIYIPAESTTIPKLREMAKEIGLNFTAADSTPEKEAFQLKPMRVGLWDRYGGSMPSGWVRWLLEKFEFDFKVVFPPEMDAGNLRKKYDVLVFVGGAIPGLRPGESSRYGRSSTPNLKNIPEEYHNRVGRVTAKETIPQLVSFLKEGGTILTIGSSTSMGYHAQLPISNALVEKTADGQERSLPMEKYFVPGSILRVRVDNSNPLAYGLPENLDVYFNRSPVFRLKPESTFKDVKPVAWFDSEKPLLSGWAWGQHYLKDGISVIEANVGKGKLFLFGPDITFRAQPHGTFKFLFNGIYYGGAVSVKSVGH
jgi:hypothetical protein